jgi:nucleoside-diphosphate-sugar epimerase
MKILVIGGTGFMGRHVVWFLRDAGHDVAVFHRGKTQVELPEGVTQIAGDRSRIAENSPALRAFSPDVVVDMIAFTEEQAQDIMAAFSGMARRIVVISSQDVYRAFGRMIGIESCAIDPSPVTEDSPVRERLYPYREQATGPGTVIYNYDKILVERVFLGDPKLPGTVLRLPMVYGPGDRQHRPLEYLKRMDDGRKAIVLDESLADWRCTRGYVEDVAAAIALAAADERAAGRVYNLGEQECLSTVEWIRMIAEAAGWKGEVVVLPRSRVPEHLVPDFETGQNSCAETRRIRNELGFTERTDRGDAFVRMVEWERANPPAKFDQAGFDYAAEDAALKS